MNEHADEGDLTRDAFLGGRLTLSQPKAGYRAGVDPVLLAASVPARSGETLLDLGCGAGAAMLCCAVRVPGLRVTGLERQTGYAALARRNADENGLDAEVLTGDLAEMPSALRQRQFTHVIANPPYFDRSTGVAATDPGREGALGEATPLSAWVDVGARRTAPKGTLTIIHQAARAPELLTAMAQHLGSLELLPLIPRRGRAARLVLLRGRKNGRAPFRLHDGWLLHEGAQHDGDRDSYTPATAAILREGAALTFPQES
ncbi:methyltransferase domain-containing protein [Roseovarius faecimaris]|uniref:Methyltransferase domain-containing protein n=1 Tax=Roseovarius faecimaris TaxID=2494550 RepID=A0A6I6J5B6_9RHOB|nr:methyltransferase [Roseovarius faecimaris]QGX99958.1 methyltransferase domain-containing protein [Roseovarius faecimaris]